MTLTSERPVVQKTVTPVERVRLDKEAVTTEETVTDEVRSERIEAAPTCADPFRRATVSPPAGRFFRCADLSTGVMVGAHPTSAAFVIAQRGFAVSDRRVGGYIGN